MSAKEIHLDESARRAFLSGVERHSTSVKTAFGPSGRVEIVAKKFSITPTNDRVITEREIKFKDPAFVQYLRGRNSVNEAEHWNAGVDDSPGLCFEILRLGLDFGRRLDT